MESLSVGDARRLALARAGLWPRERTGLPRAAAGAEPGDRAAAHAVIGRFGYLQLDTVSVAGARSHALVLHARLSGFDPALAERLLAPGEPLFEYWGHEASWMPLDLYPAFEFRRRAFRAHPWWGDVVRKHRRVARRMLDRIRGEGPLRSADLEGGGSRGWWELTAARRVASALWSSGVLAIRERRGFLRTYDLAERVIPEALRANPMPRGQAVRALILRALEGHGWATEATLRATWRLRVAAGVADALRSLADEGRIVRCALRVPGEAVPGWVRPEDLALVPALRTDRPRRDRGVLLTPFDPLLWDRARVRTLFGFEQVLEIYVPASRRRFGYFCLPVLAADRLVARVDLKADRRAGALRVLSLHHEAARDESAADREAVRSALERTAGALGLLVAPG